MDYSQPVLRAGAQIGAVKKKKKLIVRAGD